MGVIGKLFAFILFPLSALIILEELKMFTYALPVNKIFLGAGLMIALQLITLMMLHQMNHHLSFMNVMTALIFIITAAAAVASVILKMHTHEATLIFSVMMFVEAMYALH